MYIKVGLLHSVHSYVTHIQQHWKYLKLIIANWQKKTHFGSVARLSSLLLIFTSKNDVFLIWFISSAVRPSLLIEINSIRSAFGEIREYFCCCFSCCLTMPNWILKLHSLQQQSNYLFYTQLIVVVVLTAFC